MMGKGFDEIDPEQYYTRYERSPREAYVRDHWRPVIVAAIAKYCRNKIALDLGCGGSFFTKVIASCADSALGIDGSKVMLGYAKSQYPNLSPALADARHIPLKTESMDTVVSIGLFEYLEYIERTTVLGEIDRVLKPDGIGIIFCPNRYGAARMTARAICKVFGKEYSCKEPSYGEMLGLFKQSVFNVIESKMDDGLIWLPNFLDRLMGKRLYFCIERILKIFGRNPFSNGMLFVVGKRIINR